MKIKDREARDLKVFQYLAKDNIFFDASLHFGISINQLFRINKKLKLRAVDMVKSGEFSTESVAKKMGVNVEYINSIIRDFDEGKLKPDSIDPREDDDVDSVGGMMN